MNNKMAISTSVSTTESKTNKQKRDRIIDRENILMVARWEGVWEGG